MVSELLMASSSLGMCAQRSAGQSRGQSFINSWIASTANDVGHLTHPETFKKS